MKKILMPLMILATLITISSCEKEPVKPEIIGTYDGNINTNKNLRIKVATIDLDTTFTTMASTAIIKETASEDTLGLTVKLALGDIDIDIEDVPAFVNSSTEITIKDFIFEYADAFPMYVNGTAKLVDGKLEAKVIISNAPNSPANSIFDGDLTFKGSRK